MSEPTDDEGLTAEHERGPSRSRERLPKPGEPGHAEAEAVARWVEGAVIGLRLCPFALGPWKAGEVRIVISKATDEDLAIREALDEALHLMEVSEDEVGTTLVVFPSVLSNFETFLDAEATLSHILSQAGADGILQVASFHPDYAFEDEDENSVSHWTNRSPYPILHLLREQQVTAAVDAHPDPESIPSDNVHRLEGLGREHLIALWQSFRALG
jgi:hypothetical protein